jgi:peroxiredoxin (alkyl hydroperoxide reductase subunit C)
MLIGKPAPDFRMTTTKDLNTQDHEATAADYRGRWLVLFFYPADFTFVCPTEVLAFDQAVPVFAGLDADVLGVSTDSVYSHAAWMEFHIGNLSFPLASDRTQQVSRDFGVLNEDSGQSERAVFIVDPEGVVRYQVAHDDRVGRSIDEVLRVLQALQNPGRSFAVFTPREAAVAA